jgi:aconitase B
MLKAYRDHVAERAALGIPRCLWMPSRSPT